MYDQPSEPFSETSWGIMRCRPTTLKFAVGGIRRRRLCLQWEGPLLDPTVSFVEL
jgi:hypothetical protein